MTQMFDPKRSRRAGIRASIDWLHRRALEMNDPHAASVLNSAGLWLGICARDSGYARRIQSEGEIIAAFRAGRTALQKERER